MRSRWEKFGLLFWFNKTTICSKGKSIRTKSNLKIAFNNYPDWYVRKQIFRKKVNLLQNRSLFCAIPHSFLFAWISFESHSIYCFMPDDGRFFYISQHGLFCNVQFVFTSFEWENVIFYHINILLKAFNVVFNYFVCLLRMCAVHILLLKCAINAILVFSIPLDALKRKIVFTSLATSSETICCYGLQNV